MERAPGARHVSADEIDFREIVSGVWERRLWVVAITALFLAGGWAFGRFSTPMYRSEALIAPKETQASAAQSSLISQFGGLGGMVAGHFAFSTNLDRLEIISKSREVAEMVIGGKGLLPSLFPDQWDSAKGAWLPGREPAMKAAVGLVRGKYLDLEIDRLRKVVILGAETPDSTLSARLVGGYLESLNKKIYTDVRMEADSNIRFLEQQLANTSDPLLREKIQNMIAYEIEKAMLVSNKTFDILELPAVPGGAFKPRKGIILAVSFLVGLLVSILTTLVAQSLPQLGGKNA